MALYLNLPSDKYLGTVEGLVHVFYPGEKLGLSEPGAANDPLLSIRKCGQALVGEFYRGGRKVATLDLAITGVEDENTYRRQLLRLVFYLLQEVTGYSGGPWGILTGVRPTKIIHRLLDDGLSDVEAARALQEEYAVQEDKAALVAEVVRRQRPFIDQVNTHPKQVSIYIGIPFCPSRCVYCSFPGYPWDRYGGLAEAYLEELGREINAVSELMRQLGLVATAIYIGGGTPTSLPASLLDRLLTQTMTIPTISPREFTVEAGRPDTLDRQRLKVLRDYPVNRISINPQTMNDSTLARIGRRHQADDVIRACDASREAGFGWINMDVIIGLPGENAAAVARTMAAVAALKPENLTVHTMAVKRASRLRQEQQITNIPVEDEVLAMLAITKKTAAELGLVPYYLYRQKPILANLENVGYCRPGWASVYNIQVMEERQIIIGLGAGATTKLIDRSAQTIDNLHNPKDPGVYIARSPGIIRRKVDKIRNNVLK